jgi:hypothetical protein
MSVIGNIFCPECDSILDISRTQTKKTFDLDNTPSSVSEDGDDKIIKIINNILKNENIEEILSNLKFEQITNHEYFKKLDKTKKQTITNILEKYTEHILTSDATTHAFYFCKTCSWSQKIKPGTQILTKIGTNSQGTYLNLDKYMNKIYSKVLPFTRNYICPNNECPGNKEPKKHEAVMYRVNDTMKTMYTCCACRTIFNAQ